MALIGTCNICNQPLTGSEPWVGNGDGRGQQFAHQRCYEPKRLMSELLDAWNVLDDGKHRIATVEAWLTVHMSPAIHRIRDYLDRQP